MGLAVGAGVARAIAVVLATVLALVLVPLVVLAIVVASAQQLLGPQIYRDVLASERMYDRLPLVAAAQLAHQIAYVPPGEEGAQVTEGAAEAAEAEGGAPPALRALTADGWERILRELLPADWLRIQTERAIDGLLADPPPQGPVVISLVELRTHLASGSAVRAVVELVRAQRPCEPAEIELWTAGTDLPSCRPPDELLVAAEPTIAAALAGVVADIPDEVDIRRLGGSDQAAESEGGATAAVEQARTIARVGLVLPLAPIVLIVLLAVRSRRALLSWIGTPLVFAGFIALALAVEAIPLVERATSAAVLQAPDYITPVMAQALIGLGHGVVERLATVLGVIAAIVALLGIAMLVSAVTILRPRSAIATLAD